MVRDVLLGFFPVDSFPTKIRTSPHTQGILQVFAVRIFKKWRRKGGSPFFVPTSSSALTVLAGILLEYSDSLLHFFRPFFLSS